LLGILYATTDNDLKMMLAHSSIENVGIIVAGFGAGMVFVATNHPALAAIAFVAGLYHLINHSLYKTLLFFGVGAVETQTGTRDMDKLGGLIKWMPLTALAFLVGTLSIAALPPFNGLSANGSRCKRCCARRNCLQAEQNWFLRCAAPGSRSRRRWR
jgi:hydrogenase-4 component B